MTQTNDLPQPLTPPDCDLRGLPYMPLVIEKLQKSKAWRICKRRPELAFYLLNLWMRAWQEVPAASLEDDDADLAEFAMCEPRRWPKLRDELMRGWVKCSDGRLYHKVVAEIALDAWAERKAYRERTQAARAARQQKRVASATKDETERVTRTATASVTDDVTAHKGRRREEEGEGEGILKKKDTAAIAAREPGLPLGAPPDPRKAIFGDGLRWLVDKTGRGEAGLRAMLGRWAKQRGDPELAAALIAAQQQDVHDPVSWIEARLNRNVTAKSSSASRGRDMAEAALRVGERLDRDAELPQRSGVQTE